MFFLLFLLNSCFEFEEIQFKGIESVKMPKMDNKEILVDLTLKIENPNNYKIKVKPSSLNVLVADKMIGTIFLDEKVVLKKKSEHAYSTQLRLKLEDGAFFSLVKYVMMEEVKVQFKGKVKGSVYGITKKIDVDQVKMVNGKDFNFFNK